MSKRPLDSHVTLAFAVGAAALFATSANTVYAIREFDLSGFALRSVLAGMLAQVSFALAMVCAMLLAQILLAGSWQRSTLTEERADESIELDD